MKRVTFVLLLSAMLVSTSCQQTTQEKNANTANTNGKSQPTANSNTATVAFVDEDPAACQSSSDVEILVNITISNVDTTTCEIASVVPETVNLFTARQKVRWCVINRCNNLGPLIVEVDNFRVEADASMRNPFGSNSNNDNKFNSGLVRTNNGSHKTSKSANRVGNFKYDVTLMDLSGNPINVKDPHVVISSTPK